MPKPSPLSAAVQPDYGVRTAQPAVTARLETMSPQPMDSMQVVAPKSRLQRFSARARKFPYSHTVPMHEIYQGFYDVQTTARLCTDVSKGSRLNCAEHFSSRVSRHMVVEECALSVFGIVFTQMLLQEGQVFDFHIQQTLAQLLAKHGQDVAASALDERPPQYAKQYEVAARLFHPKKEKPGTAYVLKPVGDDSHGKTWLVFFRGTEAARRQRSDVLARETFAWGQKDDAGFADIGREGGKYLAGRLREFMDQSNTAGENWVFVGHSLGWAHALRVTAAITAEPNPSISPENIKLVMLHGTGVVPSLAHTIAGLRQRGTAVVMVFASFDLVPFFGKAFPPGTVYQTNWGVRIASGGESSHGFPQLAQLALAGNLHEHVRAEVYDEVTLNRLFIFEQLRGWFGPMVGALLRT